MNQADEHEHAEGHNVPWLVNHFVSGRHMVLCLLQAPEFIRGAIDSTLFPYFDYLIIPIESQQREVYAK